MKTTQERMSVEGKIYPSEEQEQICLMEWAVFSSKRLPELNWLMHVPNGGKRDVATGALMKKLGVKKGFPDMQLCVPRRGCHSLAIELKRRKETHPIITNEQRKWIRFLNEQGWHAVVCYGAEEAANVIEWYLGNDSE
jgi:hypothetical protein